MKPKPRRIKVTLLLSATESYVNYTPGAIGEWLRQVIEGHTSLRVDQCIARYTTMSAEPKGAKK